MLKAIKIEDGWIICGKCGHKLAKSLGGDGTEQIEFKCSTCKEVNGYQYSDTKPSINMANKKCSGKRCPLDSTAYNEDCTAVDHCKWFTPKIVTNRQWLESLSDEDFAKVWVDNAGRYCAYCIYNGYGCEDNCVEGHMQWLKAEHKEQENG